MAAPFYTGQPVRRRQTLNETFADRSASDRIKRDQEFEKRFKSDVARTMALDAMNDAAIVREDLQTRHIEATREWKADLRFLTSTAKPVPAEAGQHINQRLDDLFEKFDREMQEVDHQLEQTLAYAESIDLKQDRSRQKLLTYVPDYPAKFNRAAEPGAVPVPESATTPEPRKSDPNRLVLDHPFNDAATAPDPATAYLAKFARPQEPPVEPTGIDR